ncbi:MAG: DNA-directed RNA polymerase subunit omega [Deltaproteobacteria bacterium]|nr:DNA-directed RNA polymerase subunit omega [Deltaproteobacteria bacterium]
MARVTIEDCLSKVENRFVLVLMSSKRAKQLHKGNKPLIDSRDNKLVVTALREIASKKIKIR